MGTKNVSLGIIIPIFNEEKTLLTILKKVNTLKKYCDLEIIVVNDGSKDSSGEIINKNRKLYKKNINLKKNYGKGKAVIEGLKQSKSEYVIIQDADLEYVQKI